MVLVKLPVPGRPSNLAYSRARAYCACSGCGWGLFGHFYSHLSFLSSFSLSLENGPMQSDIFSQRTVKPKKTTIHCMTLKILSIPLIDSKFFLKKFCQLEILLACNNNNKSSLSKMAI